MRDANLLLIEMNGEFASRARIACSHRVLVDRRREASSLRLRPPASASVHVEACEDHQVLNELQLLRASVLAEPLRWERVNAFRE